jgi:hypothetical protein
MHKSLATVQYLMSRKQVLVPTMGALGGVFAQHLALLRKVRVAIDDLKQARYRQADKTQSWEHVEAVLEALGAACKYLDFPEDKNERGVTNQSTNQAEEAEPSSPVQEPSLNPKPKQFSRIAEQDSTQHPGTQAN